MIHEGMPDPKSDEDLGDYWQRRDLGKWMREHPKLVEMYVEGKRLTNTSGKTHEDYEQARLRKLGRLA